MSSKDRLFQSLSLARQQVLDGVGDFRDGVTQRVQGGPLGSRVQGTSSHANGNASVAAGETSGSAADLQRNNTLPLYSSRNTGPPVPQQALHAPPGQTQAQVDAMGSKVRRQSNRSGAGSGWGELKTVHTYSGAGGRAVLELHTPPQVTPTYMGGSTERGRGSVVGRLSFTPKPQERVSHITLKLKAVVRVRVPVANPHAPGPATIAGRSPMIEATTEREVLLLQLEHHLYKAREDNKEKFFEMPPSAAHDSTVSWPFQFEIPAEDRGGRAFPVSYVLSGDTEAKPVQGRHESRGASLISAGRGLLTTLKNAGQSAADANEWASVKWYLKATIGRPSMLETNDRIFAPFTYLPPPPRNMYELLDRRARTAAQLRQNIAFGQLMESSSTWQAIDIGSAAAGKAKSGLLGALFGSSSGSSKHASDWSIEMPCAPRVFTLQGSIPFCITSKTPRELGAPLVVSLFKRVNLVSKSTRATDVRKICSARIATAPTTLRSQRSGMVTYRWQGVLDVPPNCGPCFDSAILSLEYFIGIQEHAEGPTIHAEPILLMCPPPRVIGASVPSAAAVPPADAKLQATDGGKTAQAPPPPPRHDGPSSIPSTAFAAPATAPAPSSMQAAPAHLQQNPLPPTDEAGRFDELNVEGMQIDLPPSYFEATGIRDGER